MKTYKVIWEVSKYAIIKAESEDEAIEKLNMGLAEEREGEITLLPEAFEQN